MGGATVSYGSRGGDARSNEEETEAGSTGVLRGRRSSSEASVGADPIGPVSYMANDGSLGDRARDMERSLSFGVGIGATGLVSYMANDGSLGDRAREIESSRCSTSGSFGFGNEGTGSGALSILSVSMRSAFSARRLWRALRETSIRRMAHVTMPQNAWTTVEPRTNQPPQLRWGTNMRMSTRKASKVTRKVGKRTTSSAMWKRDEWPGP